MYVMDEIDHAEVARIEENQGACIRDIIRPFFTVKSESVLRHRIELMAAHGIIRLQKEKGVVRCYLPESGKGDEL